MPPARSQLITALQDPALFPHPVTAFNLIETHISWVLLTGRFAYKIKKPVDLGFLDFSTLEKRHFYCEEELRLNRRLAPQLYLEVVPITGSETAPRLGGPGPAMEYAVKMSEFAQEGQLDRVLERGELRDSHIDQLARTVAEFHAQIPIAGASSPFGTPEQVAQPVLDNYRQIEGRLEDSADRQALERLRSWSVDALSARREVFRWRKEAGYIRECHGDMHLRNMVLLDSEVVLFDCIEFSEGLRWIDTMSDVAFLIMDLDDRNAPRLSWRFLNAYLEQSGDYAGVQLLRYYEVYRAAVRANVASIRLTQEGLTKSERAAVYEDFLSYFHLAERYMKPPVPMLVVTHGLSGSGKTTYTGPLAEALGAVRIRSDVERKRLFGLASEYGGVPEGAAAVDLYSPAASDQTYARLAELAEAMLAGGFAVVVDATFLARERRDSFRRLAARLDLPFVIIDFQASPEALRQRVVARGKAGRDASDADVAVLAGQLRAEHALTAEERKRSLIVQTEEPVDVQHLAEALRRFRGAD